MRAREQVTRMEMACYECGEVFEAKRDTARYCSTRCRVRAHRKRKTEMPESVKQATASAVVGRLMDEDEEPPREAPAEGRVIVDDVPMSVYRATQDELRKAGKVGTVAGQSALALAARIDNPTLDTGSALAGMVKQLEATLAGVLADKDDDGDELDELRRRKERRRAAG
ncbi:hypothetical protein M3E78_005050 [Micrococcus luteus]|nr:hypothetical protein [Micrococcus luteus]MCV7573634.1 hypothetical protein [Micrococcus luteus]